MNHAIVRANSVVNIIVLDANVTYEVAEGCTLHEVSNEVSIGWSLVDGTFVPPEPDPPVVMPEPEDSEETSQAKYAALQELLILGITEATARAIVGLPNE